MAAIDHLWQSRSAVLGLALALLAMGGCGTGQWTYSKADASEPDRERDETECRQSAMVPRVLRPIVLEGVALHSPRWVPAPAFSPMRAIPKGDESHLMLRVTAVRDGRAWRSASGYASLDCDGHLTGVVAGDRLRVMAQAARPQEPLNPGEFDVAAHQRSRRVLCRLFGEFPDSVTVLERDRSWSLRRMLSEIRGSGTAILRRGIDPGRATLASAILLGAREQLDPERNEGYLVTGTIHVLSCWTTSQVRHCASR